MIAEINIQCEDGRVTCSDTKGVLNIEPSETETCSAISVYNLCLCYHNGRMHQGINTRVSLHINK